MNKKVFLRSELVERSQIDKAAISAYYHHTFKEPLSIDWANSLIVDLDTAKAQVQKIHDAFSNAVRNYDNLETVKHELAFIPVFFTLRVYSRTCPTTGRGLGKSIEAVNPDYRFSVGIPECPRHIFPHNITLSPECLLPQHPVWTYYPPDLAKMAAKKANIKLIKTWAPDDSLVDWLMTFIKLEDPEASIRVEELSDTEDMRYTFYFPTKFPNKESVASIQSSSRSEQVYDFISQFAPVRTRHIEEHLGMMRQQITKLLKKLVEDNRIEKVRHGVYVPVCSSGN